MKKTVEVKMVRNHFHDGDFFFSCGEYGSFDFGRVMEHIVGYDNPDEYDKFFTFVFEGEEQNSYFEMLWDY